MSTRRKLLNGGAVIGGGQVLGQGLSFARNVIVARMVSPADYGIAATFAITVLLLEMISNLNAGVLLVQAPDGNEPRLQDTAHTINAIRGVFSAAMLYLLAWPMVYLFNVPQALWAFRCLAFYPLLSGLTHLDATRVQREIRFAPSTAIEFGSQLIAALAAWPLAAWFHDYSALLWLLLLQRATATVGSHLVAERRFVFAWEKEFARRIVRFGWPLLVNGILLFFIFQGDRTVIGAAPRFFSRAHYTMADLGMYSAAFGLAATGTQALARMANLLILPVLASEQDSPEAFQRRYALAIQVLALFGGTIGIAFLLAGKFLIVLLYGGRYAAAGQVIGWLGAMMAVRTIRGGSTLAALAKGDSHNSMVANLARLLGMAGVIAAAAVGASLSCIAAFGFGAEVLALGISVWKLEKDQAVGWWITLRPALLAGAGMSVATLAVVAGVERNGWVVASAASVTGVAAFVFGGMLMLPAVRREAYTLMASRMVRAVQ